MGHIFLNEIPSSKSVQPFSFNDSTLGKSLQIYPSTDFTPSKIRSAMILQQKSYIKFLPLISLQDFIANFAQRFPSTKIPRFASMKIPSVNCTSCS
jgi:hypothetical protein